MFIKCKMVLLEDATRIIGRLGGNIKPVLPAEVNIPIENLSEYLFSLKIVKSIPPRARMVTPDAPVKDVKKAQMITVAIIIPPGIQPKKILNVRTSRSPALLSDRKKPVRVKSGIAIISVSVSAE